MPAIKELDSYTISQIAAGEIIERPEAALKEMMENAIDSKPARIAVAIAGGGFGSISVRDDGCGIPADELELAIQAHTTSKLAAVDDLWSLATLGFRGEGLASIATLARLRLRSRPAASAQGAELVASEGKIVEPAAACVMAPGTEVVATDMFANAPARRKFMGKEHTESARCEALCQRLALIVPHIAVQLTVNDRKSFDVPAQELSERLFHFYGKKFEQGTLHIEERRGDLEIEGYINPDMRSSQARQHLYINGRSVREKTVIQALRKSLADTARSPNVAFALFLTMPPGIIDVNAHPSKAEVRFKDATPIFQFVYRAVKKQLVDMPLGRNPDINLRSPTRVQMPLTRPVPNSELFGRDVDTYASQQPEASSAAAPAFQAAPSAPAALPATPLVPEPGAGETEAEKQPDDFPQQLGKTIGLLNGIYLLAESERGLVLIDIHAAHERIIYERMKAERQDGVAEIQQLLEPIELDLGPVELDIVNRHREMLHDCGLAICNLDGVEALAGIPPLLADRVQDCADLVFSCINDIREAGMILSVEEASNQVLGTMACHAAIRGANPFISEEGRRALIHQMQTTLRSGRCNHGRPCWRTISFQELDAFFERGR